MSKASTIGLGPPPRKRRLVSLTPMIDVVFLLLIFFMLASRFSVESVLTLSAAGQGGGYQGAPRLVTVADGVVRLNGRQIALEDLGAAVRALAPGDTATVVLKAEEGADIQRMIAAIDALRAAGLSNLMILE